MAPGDHLPAAVETVEELSVALAEFAPDRLRPGRDEPRRPLAQGAEHVRLGVGRSRVAPGVGVPVGVPFAVVCHGRVWGRTAKSFSAGHTPNGGTTQELTADRGLSVIGR